ncbi:MAG: 6-bladed beta-propeller [Alistipes sp.]|jgi:hypothetical protein|nr:6-bladed beta-propeller [Alistipes sp.]
MKTLFFAMRAQRIPRSLRILRALLAVCMAGSLAGGFVGCGDGGGVSDGTVTTLDIEAAIDNRKAFDLAEISDDIEFVPLDGSTTEALLGNVYSLTETENGWFLRDSGKPFKFFDRTGKYLYSRGVIGRGPDEFSLLAGMVVDRERSNYYVWGMSGRETRILAYDADGQIVARSDSVLAPRMAFSRGVFRDNKLIMWSERPIMFGPSVDSIPEQGARATLLEMLSPDLTPAGTVDIFDKLPLPTIYVRDVAITFTQGILSDNGESLLVYEALDDTVFRLGGDMTLSAAYALDLGRYAPPAGAFGSDASVAWSADFRRVTNIWEGGRYVIAQSDTHDFSQTPSVRTTDTLVFDLGSGDDGFSAVGASGKVGLFLGGVEFIPMYVRDNRLVGYMQALDIVDAGEGITNSSLRALASTLKEDSNPVLIVATLKK